MKEPMLINFISEINDPRIERSKKYSLSEIIFSAFIAILSGARSWYEIKKYAEIKLDLLRKFLPFDNGIPSHDTFNRVFRLLPTEEMEKIFIAFAKDVVGVSLEGKLINIDGKQMRGSSKASNETIHLVTAWCSDLKISLGQLKVDTKSNEITAIPKLIEKLDLKGAEVSTDAMGTQTEIAELIHKKKGHYLLALKGNQETIHNEAKELCAHYKPTSVENEFDADRGQTYERKVEVFKANKRVITTKDRWAGLKQIVKVSTTVTKKKTKEVTEDIRYYLVNSSFDAKHYLRATRQHWSVENDCHWQLDITFNEDDTRKTGKAAENFSRLLRFCMNCVRTVDFGKDNKESVKTKAFILANSEDLLMQLFYNKDKAN